MNSVRALAPYVEHRNCARHVYNNWKKKHKGATLLHIFWRAVRSTYSQEFDIVIDEMKAEDMAAYESFMEREPNRFYKAFFSTLCVSDAITNKEPLLELGVST